MKTPPLTGPAFRVVTALLLCAGCFQAGRWYQELSAAGEGHAKLHGDMGTEMVSATFHAPAEAKPKIIEPSPSAGAGAPVGQSNDIITPLNVRDPAALVMGPGPGAPECIPPAGVPPDAKKMKPLKLKKGRLLELMKESDKNSGAPKSF